VVVPLSVPIGIADDLPVIFDVRGGRGTGLACSELRWGFPAGVTQEE